MPEHEVIKSQPFTGPFVRVRGRLSRKDAVTWSPCLRTFRAPKWIKGGVGQQPPSGSPPGALTEELTEKSVGRQGDVRNPQHPQGVDPTIVVTSDDDRYAVAFVDRQGTLLVRAPVRIQFFAPDRQWALFRQRLPYYQDTHRVVLFRGERELGALMVPNHPPEFVLLHPLNSHEVDVNGILHLRWDSDRSPKTNAKGFPFTYYVRYSADGRRWHRPGVNITNTSFDLDLRDMPGGKHCTAQVIATNGYHTSYVETPPFAVPRKPPEILMAPPSGPLLFAQGFSREEGPLVGDSVVWLADGKRVIGTGASFDARLLGHGTHQLTVRVTDASGAATFQHLGWYDGVTGLHAPPLPGL